MLYLFFQLVHRQIGRRWTVIDTNNQQAAETVPRIQAGIESIRTLIDEINAMGDKVKTIASTIEKVADQSAALQEKSESIATE